MSRKKFKITNENAMKEAIDDFKQITDWYDKFENANDDLFRTLKQIGFDTRDFCFVVAYMDGYSSEDEYFKNLKTEFEYIKKDAYGFCSKFLDKYENENFKDINADTKDACKNAIMLAKLAQIPGNINSFVNGFREKRYDTTLKQKAYDNYTPFISTFSVEINNNIWKHIGIDMNTFYETQFDDSFLIDYEENKEITNDPDCTTKYDNGSSKYYEVIAPSVMFYYADLNEKDPNDIPDDVYNKYSKYIDNTSCIIEPLSSRLMNEDSFSSKNVNLINFYEAKSIFVDGVPLDEIAHYEHGNVKSKINIGKCLANAIKDGKAIDICRSYVSNGKLNSEIIPLKFNWNEDIVKAQQEAKVVREHSWFRRTFFDWGPFKIKRDPNVMEEIYGKKFRDNEANMKNRHSQILNYRNGKFLNELNDKRRELSTDENKLEQLLPGNIIESKYNQIHQTAMDRYASNLEIKEFDNDFIKDNHLESDYLNNTKDNDINLGKF